MWILIIGVIILALEIAVGSFYLLWYGLGLIVSGAIGWALGSEDWIIQGVIGLAIGLVLMVAFRKRLAEKVLGKKINDEFLLEAGEGVIKEGGLVEFRGTTWRYESEKNETFEINEKVLVRPSKTNRVFVKKIV
jgi:membrane protein implicated in regulation of membrane protease activity